MFGLNRTKSKDEYLNIINIIDKIPEPFQSCTVFDVITNYPSLFKNIIIEKINHTIITHVYPTNKDAEHSYEKYYKKASDNKEVI